MRRTIRLSLLLASLALVSCGDTAEPAADAAGPVGIEQFAWVSASIARGAQPKGEAAFRDLAAAGIRTIVSVDGARPDVATAVAFGMRYVHIPFGYDGVPRERQLALAKTVRELDGPFFIHCHHGKHRGPAGAVLAQMALGGMTPDEAVEELRRAGTDEKYVGLYACARDFEPLDPASTQDLDFVFPEVAPVPALAEAMATVDRRWDGLKLVRAAGWESPAAHPDVDPAHEALQLREILTELARSEGTRSRPEDFRRRAEASRDASVRLEAALRSDPVDAEGAAAAFDAIRATCTSCHRQYRNVREPGAGPESR